MYSHWEASSTIRPRRISEPQTWQPLTFAHVVRAKLWRCPQFVCLLAAWFALIVLCALYGQSPVWSAFPRIQAGEWSIVLFLPLLISQILLFWFGLEWALVPVSAASLMLGIGRGLPLEYLIPFSLSDAAALTILALVYRLSGLSYQMRGVAPALAYLLSNMVAALILSGGALFLAQQMGAQAFYTLRAWQSWWIGGITCSLLAAVPLHFWSAHVEDWKNRHFRTGAGRPVSYEVVLAGVLVGGVIIASIIFGVSDMLWQNLEAAFTAGGVERVGRSLEMIRTLWLLLSRVTVLLVVGLCLGGVALAWRWSRALQQEVDRRSTELEEAGRRFSDTFAHAPVGIAHVLPDGRFTLVNRKMCEILGYAESEFAQLNYFDLIDPATSEKARVRLSAFESGASDEVEFDRSYMSKQGEMVCTHARLTAVRRSDGSLSHSILILEDIRQRLQLEEQLRQSSKMEAVGRLAGGVAHDFNNLLTAILGFTEVAEAQLKIGQNADSSLTQVRRAAERAADVTSQLLAFSRRQLMEPRLLDLNAELEATSQLLPPLLGPGIRVTRDLSPGLKPVMADPSQIAQILLNLAANAKDAMRRGGSLSLTTKPGEGHALLEVTDDGEGIPDDILPHIFEPFYTTKGKGHGTGLGLATVYGIVQQMGGSIAVVSAVGEGTSFRIHLPTADGEIGVAREPDAVQQPPLRVLLVEDEAPVREFVAAALSMVGHAITAANCGEEALRVFAPGRFDVVVTDIMMPGMTGDVLAGRIRAIAPGQPFVFVSGFNAAERISDFPGPFVQKPFTVDRLLLAIAEAMRGPWEASSLRRTEG